MSDSPILSIKGEAVISCTGHGIPISNLPSLIQAFLRCAPDTRPLEAEGKRLLDARFPDSEHTRSFMRRVFTWGGRTGNRVRGIVDKKNASYEVVRKRFADAATVLAAPMSDVMHAMEHLNLIRGLGGVSYASKHLRFLCPDRCVTLDSRFAAQFRCEAVPRQWANLSRDCMLIAAALNDSGQLPRPPQAKGWSAADVEAAVFTALNPDVVMGT